MKNKKTNKIPANIEKMIPYSAVCRNEDIIELDAGLFSKTFEIDDTKFIFDTDCKDETIDTFVRLINSLPSDINFQFSFSHVGKETQKYISLSLNASSIDEAKGRFIEVFDLINASCKELNISIRNLSLVEQLKLIHGIYHGDSNKQFEDKLKGNEFNPFTLRKLGLTTKDLVGPDNMKFEKDYAIIDGAYVRVLFINSCSNHLTNGFLNTFLKAKGKMISTIHYKAADAEKVLTSIEKEIEEIGKAGEKKATNSKSKNKSKKKKETVKYYNQEEIAIKESYTALFKDAIESGEKVFQLSFCFALFASSLEELDKNTEKLVSPGTRFFYKVLPLDYQQKDGLTAIMPLAHNPLSISRTFSSKSAALFFPFNLGNVKLDLQEVNEIKASQSYYVLPSQKKVTSKKNNFAVKRTIQETIPYSAAYFNNGIFETSPGVFSKAYTFQDINYHTATEEDQQNFLLKYGQLINRFDPSIRFQIVINNRNVDMQSFKSNNLLSMKNNDLDIYRKEYNQIILKKMEEGRNNLIKERYLILTTETESVETAEHIFNRLDAEILNAFKEIGGSKASAMTTPERLELLYDIYNIGNEGRFLADMKTDNGTIKSTDLENLTRMGITTKDLIAPSGFDFKKDYFRMGDKYARVLYLVDLPNSLSDKFMSELTGASCNMVTSINLASVAPDKAVKIVKRQMVNINANMQEAQKQASKSGYSIDLISSDLKQAQEEANDLLQDLTGRNQKMFLMTFTVMIISDSFDQLDTDTEIIQSIGRKHLCNIKKLNYQQESGLNTTLPFGINELSIKRTLTTESTIIFSPFDTQELIQKEGMYYGQNASSHNLILYNRKSADNGNGWILGTPGSGKSFSAKREMSNVFLNTDDDILIIDPEREYSPLVKAFGGEIVRIAPGSHFHLNPLDMDKQYADDEDPVTLKADFVLSLCETVIGGRYGLTPSQRTIIDRCVRLLYQEYIQDFDKEKIPTLLQFQRVLEAQPEREAREIALAFEIYTKGSLDVFAHHSNVDVDNRFVVYDIKDIGSNIKTMAYLIVLDAIWNRVIQNRRKGKRTWIYIDEVYILFEREESTNFIRQIFSRCRKWGGLITCITQNVEPILQNTIATSMLSNSAFIQLLNQAPVDRDILANLLHISPTQVGYINNAPAGQGVLYIQGQGIIPFRDNFSKAIAPNLYGVLTSKPNELKDEFK